MMWRAIMSHEEQLKAEIIRLEQENADLQKRNREHRELLDDILHFSQSLEVSPDWWSVPVSEGLQERIVKMIG